MCFQDACMRTTGSCIVYKYNIIKMYICFRTGPGRRHAALARVNVRACMRAGRPCTRVQLHARVHMLQITRARDGPDIQVVCTRSLLHPSASRCDQYFIHAGYIYHRDPSPLISFPQLSIYKSESGAPADPLRSWRAFRWRPPRCDLPAPRPPATSSPARRGAGRA